MTFNLRPLRTPSEMVLSLGDRRRRHSLPGHPVALWNLKSIDGCGLGFGASSRNGGACQRRRRSYPLEPGTLFHDILKSAVAQQGSTISEKNLEAALIQIGTVPPGMRRQQHVRHRPQWMVHRKGLILEDV
jgi:hypothetical protein